MNVFAKMMLKKGENPTNRVVREKCGKRAGILCIILNTLLAGAKIALGAISGAVSVLADGFNNLTDCGSNVVSVIGFKMSGKPADKEHPFGHQRAETISALLIAVIILVVAVELIISSVQKIISPEKSVVSLWLFIILGVSIALKFFMFLLNRGLAKATESEALAATAMDSISDCVATLAVLVALIVSYFTAVELDGYAGIGVAIFIAITGIKLLKETISHLLGKAPDKKTVVEIRERVMSFDGVWGIHDLVIHSYGNNTMYVTLHVEVSANMPIMTAHDLADAIEKDFADNTDILLTVHIDPLVLDDPIINQRKEMVEQIVAGIDSALKIHDFRVVGGDVYYNVLFDVAVPFECKKTDRELEEAICEKIKSDNEKVGVIVTIERQNIE